MLLALLAGCATAPQLAALEQRWPAHLPARVWLTDVPFFPQDDYLCGPASLAMVARAAGKPVTPDELTSQVYLPQRKGALQLEMLAAARRQGLVAYPIEPHLQALLTEVASGSPVLVLQNLSLPLSPLWHYAVVIGYDQTRREILLHSGTTPRLAMSLSTFEHTWARSGQWAVRVTPPAQLPVTASPETWSRAVAPLERVDAQAAHLAYATGLAVWPQDRIGRLGLGNTAYALGRIEQAAQAYETLTRMHPDFADAWNNLAQVRLEQGRLAEAQAAIARAVSLGGPRQADYVALQERIARQRR